MLLAWWYSYIKHTESLLDVLCPFLDVHRKSLLSFLSDVLFPWVTYLIILLVITFLLVMIFVNWSLITTEFLILNQSTKFLCKKFLIKQLDTMLWHEAIKLYGCDQSTNWLWWCKTLKLSALWKMYFFTLFSFIKSWSIFSL